MAGKAQNRDLKSLLSVLKTDGGRAHELQHRLRRATADILWQLKQEASANRFERELRVKSKKL
jgi:hypothetical protein